ncbi:MAG: sarcosine oxidase subunit gamma, partial [Gammaproteobacteria bacterium]
VINALTTGDNAAAGVVLREEKCLGFVNLRLNADDSAGLAAAKKALGTALPALNTVSSNDKVSVLGFSPSEWLIITANGGETALISTLTAALADTHSLVCDVTGGTTKLNVSGKNAQDLLEKGTYVDLHDSVFKPGMLYATQIAHAPAVIIKNGSNDFTLIVRRSFSDHIARWAVDGAAEFGLSFH